METLLLGSSTTNNLTISATLASGFIKAWQAFAKETGWVEKILVLSDTPINTGTICIIGISPGIGSSAAIKPEVLHQGHISSAGVIPNSTWLEISLEFPIKVTRGSEYYLQILPREGNLHIKETGPSVGLKAFISSTGSKTEIAPGSAYVAAAPNGPPPFACFGQVARGVNNVPLLKDLQLSCKPKIRWLFNEIGPSPAYIIDDGINASFVEPANLISVNSPILNRPGLNKNDYFTSAMGGYAMFGSSANKHFFEKPVYEVSNFVESSPIIIEAITAAEPRNKKFALVQIVGSFEVNIEGKNIIFSVKTQSGLINTITANNALLGYPQLLICEYDWVNNVQRIIVDNVVFIARSMSGVIAKPSGKINVVFPFEESRTEAMVQNLAIYATKGGVDSMVQFSPAQMEQHYAAFRASLSDPSHVRI